MLNLIVAASFEHVQEAHEIALDVRVRMRERVAYAGLRRQVNHALETVFGEQLLDRRAVAKLLAHETETRMLLEPDDARLLERRIVVIVHDIETDHLISASQQPLARVIADETGSAGDQNFRHADPQGDGRPF